METPCNFVEEMKIVAKDSSGGPHYNDDVTEEIRVPQLTYSKSPWPTRSMTTVPKQIILTLVGIIVFASACGSNDNSGQAAQSFSEFVNAAEVAAVSAMLTLNDFPPGWTSLPSEDSDDIRFTLSKECEILDLEFLPGQVYNSESDSFQGPSDQSVDSDVTVLISVGAAQHSLDNFTQALSRESCRAELVQEFENLAPDSLGDVTVSLLDLSFPSLGEASNALRLLTEFRGVKPTVDIVFIRQGKMVGVFSYLTPDGEPDIDVETEIAARFATKLKAAEDALPE